MNKRPEAQRLPDNSNTLDRIALRTADLLGSFWFLAGFLAAILCYLIWNTGLLPGLKPFDRKPFDVLDTVLSVFAIVLSISVLISQRRQRRMEQVREQVEFEVNIRAENEITKILEMLHEIQQQMGISKPDKDLEEMKKELDIDQLHRDIQDKSE